MWSFSDTIYMVKSKLTFLDQCITVRQRTAVFHCGNLYFFHVALFPCCTFFILHHLHVALFCVIIFSCCTFFVLHSFSVLFYFMLHFYALHCFRFVFFSSFTLRMLIKILQHFLKSLLTYGHRGNNKTRTIQLI